MIAVAARGYIVSRDSRTEANKVDVTYASTVLIDRVPAIAAIEDIDIIPGVADKVVIAGAADDDVVPSSCIYLVISRQAEDRVSTGRSLEFVAIRGSNDLVGHGRDHRIEHIGVPNRPVFEFDSRNPRATIKPIAQSQAIGG